MSAGSKGGNSGGGATSGSVSPSTSSPTSASTPSQHHQLTPPTLSLAAALQSLTTSSATYGTDLWDCAPAVASQAEQSKAKLSKLCKFFKEKAELDKEYGKSLRKMVAKLEIEDVPRIPDLPLPPQALADQAKALSEGHTPVQTQGQSNAAGAPTTTKPADPVVDPRSFDRFMMSLRNLHLTLATNHEILSAKLLEQVYKPLHVHRDNHVVQSKRLLHDLEKYSTLYKSHLDKLLESRAACQRACADAEAARRKLETLQQQYNEKANAGAGGGGSGGGGGGSGSGSGSGSPSFETHIHPSQSSQFSSLKSDLLSLNRKALVLDAKYISAVKTMRGFRLSSDSTLAHLLDHFENLERSRMESCKEILHHYLIVQNQMLQSHLKNVNHVQHVCEAIHTDVDLQYWILTQKSGKLPIPLPEYSVFRGHPQFALTTANSSGNSEERTRDMSEADLSAMSSTDDASNEGSSSATFVAARASSSDRDRPSKSSKTGGWGWLNTLANVVRDTTGSKGHAHRVAIDHDAESALARGSNYYYSDEQAASLDGESLNSTTSPRQAGGGGGGQQRARLPGSSFGGSDEAEPDPDAEKSSERMDAERTLSGYFDAITGRAQQSASTSSPKGNNDAPGSSSSAPSSTSTSPTAASAIVTYIPDLERGLTPSELDTAKRLFATRDGRLAWSSVLNRQRNTQGGLKLASRSSLENLALVTRMFLDEALESMHVRPAQLVMIMSQSFYVEQQQDETAADGGEKKNGNGKSSENDEEESEVSPSSPASSISSSSSSPRSHHASSTPPSQRTYLHQLLQSHPIWSELRFWEEAFFESMHEKINKTAAARTHKWHSDAEQAESMHTRKQVCFSTLSTFAHNMHDFSMDPSVIVAFVEKLASLNELDEDQTEMLRSMDVYRQVEANKQKQKQGPQQEQSTESEQSSTPPGGPASSTGQQ